MRKPQLRLPTKAQIRLDRFLVVIMNFGYVAAVGLLSVYQNWLIAIVLVVFVELLRSRRKLDLEYLLERAPLLIMGISISVIVLIVPRALTQLLVLVAYGLWRYWMISTPAREHNLANTIAIMIVAMESIFLAAAVQHTNHFILIVITWLVIYSLAYQALKLRGEVAAKLLAAVWALIGAEAAWLFLTWQVSYLLPNNYLIVPQAVVVISSLAYCFGGILVAQRRGELSRALLTEYLIIGVILIAIVVAGTQWRGTI